MEMPEAKPIETPEAEEPGASVAARISIVARVEERWLTPLKINAFRTRTWHGLTAAAICAIYAGVIAYIFYRDAHTPIETAKIEEIPVEVVPPPPPPPPPPKPQPEAKQEIEKPATSAPRAPSEDKIETDKQDEATRAPKAETPPKDGDKAPEPPASPADAADRDDKAAAAKEDILKKDAEALAKAVPMPPDRPEALAKAPPKAKERRDRAALARLSGKSDLPDYKLARPTKRAPITGGKEDNRYLANVFAKIMANYRPVSLEPTDGGTCTVAFNVDNDGTILAMQIVQSSGDTETDEAAVAAVSRASPLPPLPPGAPHGLIARIGARAAPRVLRTGRDESE